MPRHAVISVLLCLAACAHGPNPAETKPYSRATAHYRVTIFDNLGGAHVHACFEGIEARELVPLVDSAAAELSGVFVDGAPARFSSGRVPLRQSGLETCADYRTRFSRTEFRSDEPASVVVSQARWLWRPEPFPRDWDVSVSVSLPDGMDVSLPWPRSAGVYQPGRAAFFRETYGVFGRFERDTFSAAGADFEVARLGARPTRAEVRAWLGRAALAVASIGDRLPRDRLHVVVVPVDSRGGPVLFGMVRRGGEPSVLLFPRSDARGAALQSDWVAVHELSHLWLPMLRSEDRWLSEGIATYLQEILRARCGLQPGERAWERLREGFARGRRSGTGRTLGAESKDMHRTAAYQRVYWAGAAFALEVDARLREASAGKTTLLSALRDAYHDWADRPGPVPGSRVLRALDEASESEFIESLGVRYAESTRFPNTARAVSVDYREMRAQITSLAVDACGVSDESSQ